MTATRVTLAIGLSLLLHALVMFAPLVQLKPAETPLPPLMAKLEPLPKITPARKPAKKPAPPKPAPPVQPLPEEAATEPATPVAEEAPQIDEAPPEAPVAETPAQPRIPLPRQAKLTFSVYQGNGGLKLGENIQRLEIDAGNYVLSSETQTTGLASIFKTFLMTQISQGKADTRGLHPQRFSEARKQSQGTQDVSAEFDYSDHKIRFFHGGEAILPDSNAQDFLSFLYQLSQLTLAGREIVPIDISNGKKLEHYELEIGAEEIIDTPLGKLRTLPMRKIHQPGEEGLIVWLALEYRLLPVKLQQLDRAGKVAGEMRISEIRVSEENAELAAPPASPQAQPPETLPPP